jgi:hypothetical protein
MFLMALQIRLFGSTELALRTTMAVLSVVGIGLVATAVYELAGSRPSKWTAWLLVIEPANVFFSTALHKQPELYLAIGLVAFGSALAWTRTRLGALLPMALGCLIATATETYVGGFLGVACLIVLLQVSIRRLPKRARWTIGLGTVAICAGIIAIPSVAQETQAHLTSLQQGQNQPANLNSRLSLGRVNFSTPGDVAVNLPRRMFDLAFRPYPWQLSDTNQRLALIETIFVLALLAVLARVVFTSGRSRLARAGPLAYPALLLWIAYSFADSNAGTGFRYRTGLIPLMIAIALTLRLGPTRATARKPAEPSRELVQLPTD